MVNVARFAAHFAQGGGGGTAAEIFVTFYTHRASVLDPYDEASIRLICGHFVKWWEFGDADLDEPTVNQPSLDYSGETRLVSVEGFRTEPTIGGLFVEDVDPPSPGLFDSDGPGPPQCAVGISLRTALDSRRGRGRIYLPCIRSGAYNAAGEIQPLLSSLAAEDGNMTVAKWGAALWRRIGDAGGSTPDDRLAVWSRADEIARTVSEIRAPQVLLTQRRRRIPTLLYASTPADA